MNAVSKTSSFTWNDFTTREMPTVSASVESLGRAGHFAKGAVYFIIGLMSFQLAIGTGGNAEGARGAIREIGQQPFGRILLGLVAFGLIAYAVWRWVQAGKDTDGEGSDAKGITKRIAFVVSGFLNFALGCFAGSLALNLGAFGSDASGSGGEQSSTTASLLASDTGRIVLGVAGVVTVVVGLYMMHKGYLAKFMTKYDLASMSEKMRRAALHAGRIGLITRGIATCIIGWFLARSAYNGTNDGEVSGMGDALAAIAAQPYGKILIGIVGFGLMCFAVHTLLMGRYRRFNVVR